MKKVKINFIEASMKYHQVTLVLTAILMILGIYSLATMARSEDPQITVRKGLVIAAFPGADELQVERQLTDPLEQYLFGFEEIRKAKWDHVQRSRPKLAEMFGQNYVEFDNSLDLRKSSPDDVKRKKDEMNEIFKFATNFIEQKPDSEIAQSWIAGELEGKDSSHTLTKVPDSGKHPHPDSKAKEEAGRLGLDYYGFGRYGTDNKVSHRVVHDTLVPVTVDGKEPKVQEDINIDTSFEEMLEEGYGYADYGRPAVVPGFPEGGMSLGHTAAPESWGKDANMSFNSNFGFKKKIPQSKYKAKKEAFPDDVANDVKQHSDVRIIKPKKPYTVSADGNKVDPVSQEGTADGIESISANNNQKLHNQGIRLATWKARNALGNFKGITNMGGGGIG